MKKLKPKLKVPLKAPKPKEAKQEPKTLTVMQVAAALQISRSKSYALVRSEGFPKIRLGKKLLVPITSFEEWLLQNTQMTYDVFSNS